MWCQPPVLMTSPRPATPSSAEGMPDRHADASGGWAPGGVGREDPRFTAVPTRTRENANSLESQVQHERVPWLHTGYVGSHTTSWVDWDATPARPSLHMLQQTLRRQQGSSATRAFDPHPVATFGMQDQGHGMHTNPPQPKAGVNGKRAARQQQTGARVNRLSPQVYSGQSYSRVTLIQGAQGRPR